MWFLDQFKAQILHYGINLVFGGSLLVWITSIINKKETDLVLKVQHGIESINDPNLREMVRFGIRYAVVKFPDLKNSDLVKKVIKAIQNATPDFIASDSDIENLINDEITKVNGDLSKI